LSIITLLVIPAFALSAESTLRPDDPNLPDDYVSVSIMSAEPGGALYSLAGHIAIRMQCPYHDLDYVFTYESENESKLVLRFLSGRLKMGLMVIPTEDYLEPYEQDGRAVDEYHLNIPLDARQNLWRVLDNHVAGGIELPYDYIERGCAQASLNMLKEGLRTLTIEYGMFPDHFDMTRREITGRQLGKYHWTWAFLNLICNSPIDSKCSNEQKIIMPADFIEVMSNATLNGNVLLDSPVRILESKNKVKAAGFTPLHLSLILLLLTVVCVLSGRKEMQYVLLVAQTVIGVVSTYLVFFSTLCCTDWSWLLIPFNILPVIFWKWRRIWHIPFGIVCIVWVVVLLVLPHRITDWPYLVLAISTGLSYLTMNFKKSLSAK